MVPIISASIAVLLPVIALWLNGKRPLRRPYLFSSGSFVFCSIAMLEELFTVKRRALAGDISGIADTIGSVLTICIALLTVTAILNIVFLAISYKNKD